MNKQVVIAFSLLVGSSAWAQNKTVATTAMPPADTAPSPPATAPLDETGVQADADQDHAWFMPTGDTVPKGSIVVTDWELDVAGVKFGVARNAELSAETLLPVASGWPVAIFLGGKVRVVETSRMRVAVNGNLLYANDRSGSESFTMGVAGAATSVCLDAECQSMVTGGVQVATGFNTDNSDGAVVFAPTVSLIGRLGGHVKALVEVDGAGYHADATTELARGALVLYGFRFYSSSISGDLGFARPVCSGDCNAGFALGIPVATFSYRFH